MPAVRQSHRRQFVRETELGPEDRAAELERRRLPPAVPDREVSPTPGVRAAQEETERTQRSSTARARDRARRNWETRRQKKRAVRARRARGEWVGEAEPANYGGDAWGAIGGPRPNPEWEDRARTDGGVGTGVRPAIVQFRGEEGQYGVIRAATPGGGEVEIDAVTAGIAGLGGLAAAGALLLL